MLNSLSWIAVLEQLDIKPDAAKLPCQDLPCKHCKADTVTLYYRPSCKSFWTYCPGCDTGLDMLAWFATIKNSTIADVTEDLAKLAGHGGRRDRLAAEVKRQAKVTAFWHTCVAQLRDQTDPAVAELCSRSRFASRAFSRLQGVGAVTVQQLSELLAKTRFEPIRKYVTKNPFDTAFWILRHEVTPGLITGFTIVPELSSRVDGSYTSWYVSVTKHEYPGPAAVFNMFKGNNLSFNGSVLGVLEPVSALQLQLQHLEQHHMPLEILYTPADKRIRLHTPVGLWARDIVIFSTIKATDAVTVAAAMDCRVRTLLDRVCVFGLTGLYNHGSPLTIGRAAVRSADQWHIQLASYLQKLGPAAVESVLNTLQLDRQQLQRLRELPALIQPTKKHWEATAPAVMGTVYRRDLAIRADGLYDMTTDHKLANVVLQLHKSWKLLNGRLGYSGTLSYAGKSWPVTLDAAKLNELYPWLRNEIKKHDLPPCTVAKHWRSRIGRVFLLLSSVKHDPSRPRAGWDLQTQQLVLPQGTIDRHGVWQPSPRPNADRWPGTNITGGGFLSHETLQRLSVQDHEVALFWAAGVYTIMTLVAPILVRDTHPLLVATDSPAAWQRLQTYFQQWGALPAMSLYRAKRQPHDWPVLLRYEAGRLLTDEIRNNFVLPLRVIPAYVESLTRPANILHCMDNRTRVELPTEQIATILGMYLQDLLSRDLKPARYYHTLRDFITFDLKMWWIRQGGSSFGIMQSCRLLLRHVHKLTPQLHRLLTLLLRLHHRGKLPIIREGEQLPAELAIIQKNDGTILLPQQVVPGTVKTQPLDSVAVQFQLEQDAAYLGTDVYQGMPAWHVTAKYWAGAMQEVKRKQVAERTTA